MPRAIARLGRNLRDQWMGAVALFLVLTGGTAYALSGTNTVFSDDIVNNQVKTADVRDDTLQGGGLGASDLRAGAVGSSEVLDNSLGGADIDESSLGTVTNSTKLGGSPASDYQRRVGGSCVNRKAISSVNADGSVVCQSAVLPIFADVPTDNSASTLHDGPLTLNVLCHVSDGDITELRIFNSGSQLATLNWVYGNGSTVNANGVFVGADDGRPFDFDGRRIEGQFIFYEANEIWTLNLHVGDGGSACEVRGTAEYAHT